MKWGLWLRRVFRRAASEADLARELQHHLDAETAAQVESGLTAEEARWAAERKFGGTARVREECREAWGIRLLDELRQDIAYAIRGLSRNPTFTATVLLTLIIGTAACTAMFSVLDAVLLRPLPYREPGRLVALWSAAPPRGLSESPSGYANIEEWRRQSRSLAAIASYDPTSAIITDDTGQARRAAACLVSSNLFETLGVAPRLGRVFAPASATEMVISHQAWLKFLAGRADVLSRALIVDGKSRIVVGIMPEDFGFPGKDIDFWLPESHARDWEQLRVLRGTGPWRVVARLAPASTLDAAQAELVGIARNLETAFPADNQGLTIQLVPLAEQITRRPFRLALWLLAAAIVGVQLIGCNNVANLLLARGAARGREFAIRTALGAGRGRLIRQMSVETLVLALLAAAGGAGLATLILKAIVPLASLGVPRLDEARIHGGVLGFAVLLAAVSALGANLFPAIFNTRAGGAEALRAGGRIVTKSPAARRVRAAIVVTEFALAVLLLAGAGLLLRSFSRLMATDTGFRHDDVLVAGINFPRERPLAETVPFIARLLERARSLPSVVSAAVTEEVRIGVVTARAIFADDETNQQNLPVRVDAITADYFRTVGVAVRAGQIFGDDNRPDAPAVALINETLARRLWLGTPAVGRRIRVGNDGWRTIVGVVADLRRQGRDRVPIGQIFVPFAQAPSRNLNLVVAATGDSTILTASLRTLVSEVDRSVPVPAMSLLREQLDRDLAPRQFVLGLVSAFAAIGLVLATIGVFGLMNYSVVERTQEIGVRLALGASENEILRLILNDGLRLAGLGIGIGTLIALAVMPAARSLLFEVGPFDPVAFVGAPGLLAATALIACYLPARRALGIDPVVALRSE